jgi:hypothetical protein
MQTHTPASHSRFRAVTVHTGIRQTPGTHYQTLVAWTGDDPAYVDLVYMIDFEAGAYEVSLGRALAEIGKQIEERALQIIAKKKAAA